MRLLLLLLFLASSAFAQKGPASPPASCGPANTQFSVKLDRSQHSLGQPAPGKALVYVLEEFQTGHEGFVTPTIRVGLDGAWIGATRGQSYLFFSVDPGEHHLCANWQSSVSSIASQYSLTSFTGESGKLYFFKVAPRLESFQNGGNAWQKDLAPVERDEANYLLGISSLSIFSLHK
jgi:hypothetical protein